MARLKETLQRIANHPKKILTGAIVLGTLAVNPDNYFSECLIGARDVSELPYMQLDIYKSNEDMPAWSPRWMSEHRKLDIRACATGLESGSVSYKNAFEYLKWKHFE